ncbi:hypothetical protein Tco_1029387 [Tanacetum coccineum]|uniref:Uncharacterized protein n=1 Tax=Tanacetum coccineum TaxID=301880 RepID=A0ABQ5G3I5_9ASTR
MRMKMRMLRTDRGGEFFLTSNESPKYCKEKRNGSGDGFKQRYLNCIRQAAMENLENEEDTSTQDTFWTSFVVEGVDNENATPVNIEINDNIDNTYQEQDPINDPNSPITPSTISIFKMKEPDTHKKEATTASVDKNSGKLYLIMYQYEKKKTPKLTRKAMRKAARVGMWIEAMGD